MALPEQRFVGIDKARFDALVEKVKQHTGVIISGPSGEAEQGDYRLRWDYDATSKVLAIQCLKKPFWAPASTVQARIAQLVQVD